MCCSGCPAGCCCVHVGLHDILCTHSHMNACTHSYVVTQVGDGSQSGSFREQRIKGWRHLCVGELLVWIGITIKMGTLGRCRAAHYWSSVDGFGDGAIKATMKKNRYNEITGNLAFAPRGTPGGWAKIGWLDEWLRKRCQEGCGITGRCAVDETMIKSLCKLCPWIQYMPKKPIQWGN